MPSRSAKLLGVAAGAGGAMLGAEEGPNSLRALGLIDEIRGAGWTIDDLGNIPGVYETVHVTGPQAALKNLNRIVAVNRHTHAAVVGARKQSPDDFMLIVGGDHSLAIGTLGGLSDACERLGILWIDAHADFNTPGSSPSGNIHGMCLAVACGYGHRDLIEIAASEPMVEEEDVCILGLRDVDPGEEENLAETAVRRMTMNEYRSAGIVPTAIDAVAQLASRCDHVHLSFDIDALDAPLVPGTGTPVPGGLSRVEALDLLTALGQQGKLRSAEFVEYNPTIDRRQETGRLTVELITTFMRNLAG